MQDRNTVLIVCEQYYLRFYGPLADHLARSGFQPVWVTLDGHVPWNHPALDPGPAIERLADAPDLTCRDDIDAVCRFERIVFEQPDLFRANYSYTMKVVRTAERARRLAEVWYRATRALLARFQPRAVFLWNGRYLPYSAVSAACEAAGQPFFTSEIGWIPGTIFLDRGALSADTTDLLGRTFESPAAADVDRAESFLRDYTAGKATMVSQTVAAADEVRQRLLGADGRFLLLYGCQVDWDTNVVIGARRFHSNEAAVSFLMACASAIPGARVVVKTHPLDSDKKEDRLRGIVGDRGAVVSDTHPHTLIEAADCVAVRNSTLGFEALCYGKPLMLLEHAKYRHPRLTLDADTVEEGVSALLRVSTNACDLPDRETLRRFILHLLDRYLVPGRYDYFFEPAKLELLSHFARSESRRGLEQVLHQASPAVPGDVDAGVSHALEACKLHQPRRRFSLSERVRRLADWVR
jgi:hypothetical protein